MRLHRLRINPRTLTIASITVAALMATGCQSSAEKDSLNAVKAVDNVIAEFKQFDLALANISTRPPADQIPNLEKELDIVQPIITELESVSYVPDVPEHVTLAHTLAAQFREATALVLEGHKDNNDPEIQFGGQLMTQVQSTLAQLMKAQTELKRKHRGLS